MVAGVLELAAAWTYDGVGVDYAGRVVDGQPASGPSNPTPGRAGGGCPPPLSGPARSADDAAMQALGCYNGGKMLFLGLGTGLGSAMIIDGIVVPMELGHLPYRKKRTFEDYVGRAGLDRDGQKKWRRYVADVADRLIAALQPNDTVIGGGNATKLGAMPPRCRQGQNADAFRGGFQLWAEGNVVPARLPPGRSRSERKT